MGGGEEWIVLEFEQVVFETSSCGVGDCVSLVIPGLCVTVLGVSLSSCFCVC